MAQLIPSETLQGASNEEMQSLMTQYMSFQLEGKEDNAKNLLKGISDREVLASLEKFDRDLENILHDVPDNNVNPPSPAITETQESLAEKKQRILKELNQEILLDPKSGGDLALKKALQEISKDPVLSKDREFINSLNATAKNYAPQTDQSNQLNIQGHHDLIFQVPRGQKLKWLKHHTPEKLESIVQKHLHEMYLHLGINAANDMVKGEAKSLLEGKIPLYAQLATADSTAFLEKSRQYNRDLEGIQLRMKPKTHAELKNLLKTNTKDFISEEFNTIKLMNSKGIEHYTFLGTGTEKVDVVRQLIMDMKVASLDPIQRSKKEDASIDKAMFNAEQIGDKDLISIISDFKNIPEVRASKENLLGRAYSTYLRDVNPDLYQTDLKHEVSVLESGRRPISLDSNVKGIQTNAQHYANRKGIMNIATELIQSNLQSRSKEKSHYTSRDKEQTMEGYDPGFTMN
jgi:hypothetical protein